VFSSATTVIPPGALHEPAALWFCAANNNANRDPSPATLTDGAVTVDPSALAADDTTAADALAPRYTANAADAPTYPVGTVTALCPAATTPRDTTNRGCHDIAGRKSFTTLNPDGTIAPDSDNDTWTPTTTRSPTCAPAGNANTMLGDPPPLPPRAAPTNDTAPDDGADVTEITTGAETCDAPKLSVARAVIERDPEPDAVHDTEYGADTAEPTDTPSTKNSTPATDPSSDADAANTTTEPATTDAPATGAVTDTTGNGFAGGSTVIATGAEVCVAPRLSVARAVIVCAPAVDVHVAVYGAAATVATTVPSTRNVTFAIEPSSDAVAVNVTGAPAVNVAPFTGAVSVTVGGGLGGVVLSGVTATRTALSAACRLNDAVRVPLPPALTA
jgi:hypothetical protein